MKKIWLTLLVVCAFSLFVWPLALAQSPSGSGSGSAAATATGSSGDPIPVGGTFVAPTGSGSAVFITTGSGNVQLVPTVTLDPAHPLEDVGTATAAIKTYGIVWGAMLVLFAIGTFIIKNNDQTHWLSQDHVLPVGVAVLGTIGQILQAHFVSGNWGPVIVTAGAGLMLVLQKSKPGITSGAPAST